LISRRAVLGAALLPIPARAEERAFMLAIVRGHLPAELRTLRVRKGDTVRIDATADQAAVLHVHGLRIEIAASPDQPGSATFGASATGRFPIHLHGANDARSHRHGAPLAYLEVHPQ
jgi:FtsP/CotA-like multicopper oxidase with cupredoxin domain